MPTATFDQWIGAVFDHPLRKPAWYWDSDFDEYWDALGLFEALTVENMTRLFSGPDRLGIWFLIGESSPRSSAYALLNSDILVQERINCVHSMTNFFRAFVTPAALGVAEERKNAFHIACYMWWDIFPTYGGPGVGEPQLHTACLKTMASILTENSELCQLSALHGLNHWHVNHAENVEGIVDAFLRETPGATRRIIEYAALARSGSAL